MFDLYDQVQGMVGTKEGRGDYDASPDQGLSKKEKRKKRIREFNSREGYRNYSGKQHSYFFVVLIELVASIIGIAAYGLLIFAFAIGFFALATADILVGTIMWAAAVSFVSWVILRPMIKRIVFFAKLRRICKKGRCRLYVYGSPFRYLRRFSNRVDFSVEVGGVLYECMFMPPPRKIAMLRFEKPGEVKIVTGFIKSRIKFILGVKERVRVKNYGFNAAKNAKKVLLLNPSPRELYYYDEHDKIVAPGDTGVSFFGYTAYSGSGFIGHLRRELGEL